MSVLEHLTTNLLEFPNMGSFLTYSVKNPPAMQETLVWFLGGEDPLEKG